MNKRVSTASSSGAGIRLFDVDRMSEPVRTAALGSDHSESDHGALSRSVLHLGTAAATPTAVRRPHPNPAAPPSASSSAGGDAGVRTAHPHPRRRPSSARVRAPQPHIQELSPDDEDEMRARAEAMVAACLLKSRAAWDGTKHIFDDPKQWKLHYAKTHVAIYRHRGPGPPPTASASAALPACGAAPSPTAQHFVATGRIPGLSLQDVEYGNYADTTPDERAANAYLYRDYFLDAAVLKVVDAQTDADPFRFFGLKWSACAAPRGHNLFSPRDMAYFEYATSADATSAGATSADATSADAGRVLVKIVHSVDEAVVPALSSASASGPAPFVRAALSMSTMYRFDAKTNAVQVFAEGWIDPKGRGSSWLGSAFLSTFVPPLVRIEHCADIKYIMKHGLVFPLDHPPQGDDDARSPLGPGLSASAMAMDQRPSWVPDHQRKVCFVCFKSFGLVRRHRHHCRMCGEVMCARCMVVLPLVAPSPADESPSASASASAVMGLQQQPAHKELLRVRSDGFPAVHAVKLCKKCMFHIRQERKGALYGLSAAAPLFAGFRQALGMPSMLLRQFPIVLTGTRAVGPGEYPYHPFPGHNRPYELYADAADEDEPEEDEETYARRIEALRRAHLEQEQRKNARASIRLYDADDLRKANGEPSPLPGSAAMNFDGLLLAADGPMESPAAAPTANELFRNTLSAADAARRVSVTLLPPADVRTTPRTSAKLRTTAPIDEADADEDGDAGADTDGPEPRGARSLSIPDQLERVEKSIAQQGALLQSIARERSKLHAAAGQGAGSGGGGPVVAAAVAAAAAGERPGETGGRKALARPASGGDSPRTAPTAMSGGSA